MPASDDDRLADIVLASPTKVRSDFAGSLEGLRVCVVKQMDESGCIRRRGYAAPSHPTSVVKSMSRGVQHVVIHHSLILPIVHIKT